MKIVFSSTMPNKDKWLNLIKENIKGYEIFESGNKMSSDAEMAIVWNPPNDFLINNKNIKIIFNMGAGVDSILNLPGLNENILIVRIEDAGMAVQMAEYALYAVLGLSRKFNLYRRLREQHQWSPQAAIDRDYWTIGVLGLGKIGSRVAQTFAALEYPVAGWSRSPHDIQNVQGFFGADQLTPFLSRTRILINALPLTNETQGILNKRNLEALLPNSYLINVGRGDHLVEEDLLSLLHSGHMLGATLDVFKEEPLPSQHPFWADSRIEITPHVSATSLPDLTVKQIAEKIDLYKNNREKLTGLVSLGMGY